MADQQQQQNAWGRPPQQQGGFQNQGYQGRGRGGGRGGYQQPQLPPGWQLAFAPTGEPYYVDHNTRTTHWTLPLQYQQMQQQQQHQGHYGGGRGGRGGSRGRAGIDSQKRKTKMCMNFENGSCAWGDKCAFAHGANELIQSNNTPNPQQQSAAAPTNTENKQ